MPEITRTGAIAWGATITLTLLLAVVAATCGSREELTSSTTTQVADNTASTTRSAQSKTSQSTRSQSTNPPGAQAPSAPNAAEDLEMQASDFRSILTMTKVRGFYIDNKLGHLDEALRVANSPTGGIYPVGTIIQLIPTEVMVKRRKGFNATTRDWEFFFVGVSAAGTEIKSRGANSVRNGFGLGCQSCHAAADPKWDMICEDDHGCAPLPFTDSQIETIQNSDPRPR